MEIYINMLPFFLIIVALILSTIYTKSFFFTLPVIFVSLFIFGEEVFFIQVALLFFWILYIISHFRLSGIVSIRQNNVKMTKLMFFINLILGIMILFFINSYLNLKLDFSFSKIFSLLATGFICFSLVHIFLYYMIAPIFVKSVEYKEEVLEDYFRIDNVKNKSGNYIKFKGDIDIYKVDLNNFKKFRGRIGVRYSYIKYVCIFNVKTIDKIQFNQDEIGNKSNWENLVEEGRVSIKKLIIILGLIIILVWSMVIISWILNNRG